MRAEWVYSAIRISAFDPIGTLHPYCDDRTKCSSADIRTYDACVVRQLLCLFKHYLLCICTNEHTHMLVRICIIPTQSKGVHKTYYLCIHMWVSVCVICLNAPLWNTITLCVCVSLFIQMLSTRILNCHIACDIIKTLLPLNCNTRFWLPQT